MSAQIRHILDDANMDDEDIMRIMSIVEKLEALSRARSHVRQSVYTEINDLKEENAKLKEKLTSIQEAIKDVL